MCHPSQLSATSFRTICKEHLTLSISDSYVISNVDTINACHHSLIDMINEKKYEVLIFDEKHIRDAYDLQWLCKSLDTLICISDKPFHKVISEPVSHLSSVKLWDYIGFRAKNKQEASGFYNSYDGELFSNEEFDNLSDSIIEKLKPYLTSQSTVLEIGCAGGLLLDKLMPLIQAYDGIDQSGKMIEKTKQLHHDKLEKARFHHMSADKISSFEQTFDVIILNSVVQYFPDLNYFYCVITDALNLLNKGGMIVLGDLMDLSKKEALIEDTLSYKEKFPKKKTKTDWSKELFIHPAFLQDLEKSHGMIQKVICSSKISTIENELSKFRFDALIIKADNTTPITSNKKRYTVKGGHLHENS